MRIEEIERIYANLPIPGEISADEVMNFINIGSEIAVKYAANIDKISFHQYWNTAQISDSINHQIPESPVDLSIQLKFVKENLIPYFPSTGSQSFLAYIPSDPLPQSMIMASLTPFFNQFVGSVQGSPGGTAIESLVIKWIAGLLGLPDATFGCFTSGGSMANLTAIFTGLVHQLEQNGINIKLDGLVGLKRPMIYVSDQTHNAIEKAIVMLGLGSKSIHVIKTGEDCRLTKGLVETAIQADIEKFGDALLPLMIIGTAGTTNTGSIDDLVGLKDICNKYKLWFHIDGAYGAFTKIAKISINELSGISRCDSIALDCHKWLYTPFEAGVVLVKDHRTLRNAFELSAEYLLDSELENENPLQRNFRAYGFPLTRELRGLKVWSVIMSYGIQGLSNAITRDILKAELLRELIKQHPRFELMNPARLSVVCFRYKGTDQDNDWIIQQLQDRRNFYISRTSVHGVPVIRTCFINRRSSLQRVNNLVEELNLIIRELYI